MGSVFNYMDKQLRGGLLQKFLFPRGEEREPGSLSEEDREASRRTSPSIGAGYGNTTVRQWTKDIERKASSCATVFAACPFLNTFIHVTRNGTFRSK